MIEPEEQIKSYVDAVFDQSSRVDAQAIIGRSAGRGQHRNSAKRLVLVGVVALAVVAAAALLIVPARSVRVSTAPSREDLRVTDDWKTDVGAPTAFSPQVSGDNVVVITASDISTVEAVMLDRRTGAVRWRKAIPQISSTPLIVQDLVVLAASSEGRLLALRVQDGSIAWEAPVGALFELNPDTLAETNGAVLVGNDAGEFRSIDAATGTERWQAAVPGTVSARPVARDGVVYAPVTKLPLDDVGNGAVVALDEATGATLWTRTLDGAVLDPLDVGSGFVVATTQRFGKPQISGSVWWINRTTGVGSSSQLGGKTSSNGVQSNGIVIAAGSDGPMRGTDTGAQEAANRLEPEGWAVDIGRNQAPSVVLLGAQVVAAGSELHAVAPRTGATIWTAPVRDAGFPTDYPVLAGRFLVAVSRTDGDLAIVDSYNGRVLARRNEGTSMTIALEPNAIIAGSRLSGEVRRITIEEPSTLRGAPRHATVLKRDEIEVEILSARADRRVAAVVAATLDKAGYPTPSTSAVPNQGNTTAIVCRPEAARRGNPNREVTQLWVPPRHPGAARSDDRRRTA